MSGEITHFDMSTFVSSSMETINTRGKSLQEKINSLGKNADGTDKEVGPEEMLALQFQIGQYNTLVESISTATKGVVDSMKSVAQRAS